MVDLIYRMIYWVAEVHDRILSINDQGGYYFNDKQLHFLVIGAAGMLMIFVAYPLFRLLASTGHTMVIAWLYVFTLILVITFAIEIGQWYSGTGRMEAADIAYGVAGFLVMFAVFALIRGVFNGIVRALRRDDSRYEERKQLKKDAEESRRKRSYSGFVEEQRRVRDLLRPEADTGTAEIPSPAPESVKEYTGEFDIIDVLENQEVSPETDAAWEMAGSEEGLRQTFIMDPPSRNSERESRNGEERSDISERPVHKG